MASEGKATSSSKAERRFDLDWLRVLAFGLLIFYHSGLPFVSDPWHIKNDEHSVVLEDILGFTHLWRLPLLFVVSGAAARLALGRRSPGSFALERLGRLGWPMLFGALVVVPPQLYLQRLRSHVFDGSFLTFYPLLLQGREPAGRFGLLHLWYLAYVLVFSLVGLPLLVYLRGRGLARLARATDFLARHPPALMLLALPLTVFLLVRDWPATHDSFVGTQQNLEASFTIFLYGYAIYSNERLLQTIERWRNACLGFGLTCYLIRRTILWLAPDPVWALAADPFEVLFVLAWVMAAIGHAARHLRRGGAWLRYATEAVYPFYILHQMVTVALAFIITPWTLGIWPKYGLIAAGTFGITWAIYEGLVRHVWFLRPCFGLKPAKAARSAGTASPPFQLSPAVAMQEGTEQNQVSETRL
jgi:glucans biosynthesis protein C